MSVLKRVIQVDCSSRPNLKLPEKTYKKFGLKKKEEKDTPSTFPTPTHRSDWKVGKKKKKKIMVCSVHVSLTGHPSFRLAPAFLIVTRKASSLTGMCHCGLCACWCAPCVHVWARAGLADKLTKAKTARRVSFIGPLAVLRFCFGGLAARVRVVSPTSSDDPATSALTCPSGQRSGSRALISLK